MGSRGLDLLGMATLLSASAGLRWRFGYFIRGATLGFRYRL